MEYEQPLAKHFKAAELQLYQWQNNGGDPVVPTRIDMHVLSQLSEYTFMKLDRMSMFEYQPLLTWLQTQTMMPIARVEGVGPWSIIPCHCCMDCGILCTCGRECECEGGEPLFKFREFMTRDFHATALGSSLIDTYKRAELLAGMPVEDMPYGEFRLLDLAIGRSISSPFWPREQDESLSITGTESSKSSVSSLEEE